MRRVLLLLPTASYRAPDFLEAARRLDVSVTVGSEERNVLTDRNPAGYLQLDFREPSRSLPALRAFAAKNPISAVVGADDRTTEAAAVFSRALKLPANPVGAVRTSRDKRRMRLALKRAGVPVPGFRSFKSSADPARASASVRYPCVLKPVDLAASQGVMRADGPGEFVERWDRLLPILRAEGSAPVVLVEDFVPGREVAVEGILERGALRPLAVFDKPDPLDGPYFEETLYVQPTRLPRVALDAVLRTAARAVRALGLKTGPVHAELRWVPGGSRVIEVAARPIGGRCSRALRLGERTTLEEVILKQALGLPWRDLASAPAPSGVMMIPIPGPGILSGVEGLEAAKAVPGVEEVLITAARGRQIAPPPEGGRYLGFIFARGGSPDRVEASLRAAFSKLRVSIEPALP